jgi:hypothetical protein
MGLSHTLAHEHTVKYVFLALQYKQYIQCYNKTPKSVATSSSVSLSVYLSIYLSLCLCVYLSIHGSTELVGLGRFFSFLIIYTVGRTPWTGDQNVARLLPVHTTQTQNKRTRTSMPRVGLEHTIPPFERAETVHAVDRAATVIGRNDLGRKRSWPNFRYNSETCLKWLRKAIKKLRSELSVSRPRFEPSTSRIKSEALRLETA